MDKKKKTIIGSVAAIFCAATLALFGISGETIVEMKYDITYDDGRAYMEVKAPDEYKLDVVELMCNNQSVTKTVLPDGKLTTIPFIFSNLGNCELRFSQLNKVVGIGSFKNGKLYVALRDDIAKNNVKGNKSEKEQKDSSVVIDETNPLYSIIDENGKNSDNQTVNIDSESEVDSNEK